VTVNVWPFALAFWAISFAAGLLALGQLLAALALRGFFRPLESATQRERRPVHLSLMISAEAGGVDLWLAALRPPSPLFPGDTCSLLAAHDDDAARQRVEQASAAARRLGIVAQISSAPSADLLAHTLEQALQQPGGGLLAFAAADTLGSAALLDEGIRACAEGIGGGTSSSAGAAFALEIARPGQRLGSALLAAAQNALLTPTWGAVVRAGPPRFIQGGFWVAPRSAVALALPALSASDGSEPPGFTIGAALSRAGRRNRVLRRTLTRTLPELPIATALFRVGNQLRRLPLRGARRVLLWLSWSALPLTLVAALLGALTSSVATATIVMPLLVVVVLRGAALYVLQRTLGDSGSFGVGVVGMLALELALWPWALSAAGRGDQTASA
jgi:hypothetical protein